MILRCDGWAVGGHRWVRPVMVVVWVWSVLVWFDSELVVLSISREIDSTINHTLVLLIYDQSTGRPSHQSWLNLRSNHVSDQREKKGTNPISDCLSSAPFILNKCKSKWWQMGKHVVMIFLSFFKVQGSKRPLERERVELGQSWDRVARMIGRVLSDI
jgi:hypothetical protein